MKTTYSWLKDFVEIKITPQVLAEKMTMAGLEVTALEAKDQDYLFEIEVTSNRPDWLSVIGIAREVAAITGSRLKAQGSKAKAKIQNFPGKGPLKIEIQSKKDCPLYTAKIISGVKVGPSPEWMRKRLELIGCRSVNNIVDITNYILFTWGQPLHAFDLEKLAAGPIVVRRGKDTEKIITIDAEERKLSADILVIADQQRPVAIAGIMGGKDTEVGLDTKDILLEAAVFDPELVRRGRRAQGLQSESAYRFERGVSLGSVEAASLAAAQLIQELAGGRQILAKSSSPVKRKKKTVLLDTDRMNKILGLEITPGKIKKILNSLDFKTKPKAGGRLLVEVPAHRLDVALEVDLIEEVARIAGYTSIPATVPAIKPRVAVSDKRDLVARSKDILLGLGLNEVITYSMIDQDLLRNFAAATEAVEVANPLSAEQEILRPTLLPSLARCAAANFNHQQEDIRIFEIAPKFLRANNQLKEELSLGIAISGTKFLLLRQGLVKDAASALHLKGILEVLCARLGIKRCRFSVENAGEVNVYLGDEKIGIISQLKKGSLDYLGIKNREVFVAEVSLERILALAQSEKKFVSLPKYPGIIRDISFVLKEETAIERVLEAIKEKAGPLLAQADIVDYYKGKQIPSGYRGFTISCLYRSDERTLTEAEINPLHSLVLTVLTGRFEAKIR